jgi:hypothetical protein
LRDGAASACDVFERRGASREQHAIDALLHVVDTDCIERARSGALLAHCAHCRPLPLSIQVFLRRIGLSI